MATSAVPLPHSTFSSGGGKASAVAVAVAGPSGSASNKKEMMLKLVLVRIGYVIDRLAMHFKDGSRSEPQELFDLCFALARGIDYAITYNQHPPNSLDLATVVKQVYQRRNEVLLRSAVLVLMISVKNACRNNWFQVADTVELFCMAKEVCGNFCVKDEVTSETNNALKVISHVMPRFYPQMELTRLIVSFEVKPGYDILVRDVNIPRDIAKSDRIQLFVAQTDNLETSSCVISPPEVSFLINGKGVERRTNVSLNNGPQFPTDITKMLNYGMNLFQAIGSFNGNCLIAIAVMKTVSPSDVPNLQCYVQPVVAELASDSEVTEGPSRISLNCPISCRRIKIPVKGYLCRHHQCLDFNNFMEINSIKPSWHCPCCNQPVSYIDMRIDQKMVKILQDVNESDSDVVINADGSWKVSKAQHGGATTPQTGTTTTETNRLLRCSSCVVDLTMEEDYEVVSVSRSRKQISPNGFAEWSGIHPCKAEDKKSSSDGVCGLSVSEIQPFNATSMATESALQVTGEMVDMIFSPSTDLDTAFPAFSQDDPYGCRVEATNATQNAPEAWTDPVQLQQQISSNSIFSNVAGRPAIVGHVDRTPIPVQGFASQAHYGFCHQRAHISGNSSTGETEGHQFSINIGVPSQLNQLQSLTQVNSRAHLDQLRRLGGCTLTWQPYMHRSHGHQAPNQLMHTRSGPSCLPSAQLHHTSQASAVGTATSSVDQQKLLLASQYATHMAQQSHSLAAQCATNVQAGIPTGAIPNQTSRTWSPLLVADNMRFTGQVQNMRGNLQASIRSHRLLHNAQLFQPRMTSTLTADGSLVSHVPHQVLTPNSYNLETSHSHQPNMLNGNFRGLS